jgi:hypothetical protein
MALDSYTNLKAAVATHLARSDLTTPIVDFITLAEAKFQRTLRTRQMEQRSTAVATEYMALPTNFLELRNIQINGSPNYTLEQLSPFEIDAKDDGTSGRPAYYCLLANQIQLSPAPDSTYTLEIDYYEQIPVLSGSNASNWLLAAAPDAYLYGALMEAAAFLIDDPRVPLWQAALTQVINQIQGADRRARWSGSPLAVRAA